MSEEKKTHPEHKYSVTFGTISVTLNQNLSSNISMKSSNIFIANQILGKNYKTNQDNARHKPNSELINMQKHYRKSAK